MANSRVAIHSSFPPTVPVNSFVPVLLLTVPSMFQVYRLIREVIGEEWLPVSLWLIMAPNGSKITNLRDTVSIWLASTRY